MSSSSLIPFIFWNKNSEDISHHITCIIAKDDFICTGSETGELCFWQRLGNFYSPDIICTIGKDVECRALVFIAPPSAELISSDMWIVSLHADQKLRTWDISDGRCISSSSSKMIQSRMTKMIDVQNRVVAVTGDIKDIVLIDVWTMEILGSLAMNSLVIWIESSGSSVIAMDSKGEINCWELSDYSCFYYNKSNIPEISQTPTWSFSLNSENPAISFTINSDASILAIIYENRMTFVHSKTFKSKLQEISFLDIEKRILKAEFVDEFLYVVLADRKILRYEILKVLDEIGLEELFDEYVPTIRKSFVTVKSSSVKQRSGTCLNSLDSLIVATDITLENFIFSCNSILAFKNETIVLINLRDIDTQKILSSFASIFSLKESEIITYADCKLLHLFKENEKITVSTVILSDNWPFYVIGTSLGNIYVCCFLPGQPAIAYKYHKNPIICILLSKGRLVTCSDDNIMCIWNFNQGSFRYMTEETKLVKSKFVPTHEIDLKSRKMSIDLPKREPIHIINVYANSINLILQLEPISEPDSDPTVFQDNWEKWDQTLLAQCEDGSILLISLITNEVVFYFQALMSRVKEALINTGQEYLILMCEDERAYIFNMMSQALERIVVESESKNYIRRAVRARILTETLEDMDENMIDKHKVVQFNIRQQFLVDIRTPLSVKIVSIAGKDFPSVVLNVNSISKKISKLKQPPAQLEYVLSLLTCWLPNCNSHAAVTQQLQDHLKLEEPVVKNSIGTIGVDGCLSFAAPKMRDRYEISGYVSSLLMSGVLSIINSLKNLKINLRKNVKQLSNSHRAANLDVLHKFKDPDPAVLALQFISGNQVAGDLLESVIPFLTQAKIDRIVATAGNMIKVDIRTEETGHYVSLIESLASTLLGFLCINSHQIESEIVESLVTSLRNMMKSGIQNYISIAAKFLGDGIAIWKINLNKTQIIELSRELLIHSEKENQDLRDVIYKALFKIVACDVNFFLEFLSKEIDNFTFMKTFPETCLIILNKFISHKYEEAAIFLPGIIEVIMRTLDPHSPIIRKKCLEKAGEALKILIRRLPMVAFSQVKQRLAIGTLDKLIVIYDLKTANQWKVLAGHDGPVSAVNFDSTGKLLASYSSKDNSIRIWKMEKGFFQELIRGSNSKPWLIFAVDKINPKGTTYKEYLDTIKLEWADDNKSLKMNREDGNMTVYNLK